jgi:hypothetical protein
MGKERKGKGEPGGLAIIEVLREVHSLAKRETREEGCDIVEVPREFQSLAKRATREEDVK